MPRNLFQFALLIAASLATVGAQQPSTPVPPAEQPPAMRGISIPAVPGLPFSATVVMESEREWPDGSPLIRRTINIIARDSQGRTHNEVRRLSPESFHGSPELMSVRIFDPQTRIRVTYEPAQQTARREFVPKQASGPPNPFAHTEDLGTTTLNGLLAKGTRRTYTISGVATRDGESVEVEDETWYSPDLHLNLLMRHTDPRVGVQTVGVSGLKREEPAASLFEVPQGYKIVDVTPPNAPAPTPPPAQASTPEEPPL
jgi:hypothetical protein